MYDIFSFMRVSIKISGPAGAGIKVTGNIIQKVLKQLGFYTFGYSEYPSLIRGGHNTYQIDFSSKEINSSTKKIDILVSMDSQSIDIELNNMNKDGVIITDIKNINKEYPNIKIIPINLTNSLFENNIPDIMKNIVLTGVIMAICDYPLEVLNKEITKVFNSKGPDIIEQNIKAAKLGFDLVEGTELDMKKGIPYDNNDNLNDSLIINANESSALSFISSNGKLFSAYPMTPSSGILHYLAKVSKEKNIAVRQASNEIEAIGIALGASYAGINSMVATSGGGYDLMTEFISMAGISEIPIVIVNSQRPGPATGMPTWQEQSDLNLVKYSSHGEFPKVILAPGDPFEAYFLLNKAFDISNKYSIPVIVLLDKHVSESFYTIPTLMNIKLLNNNYIIDSKDIENYLNDKAYKRYSVDNISNLRPIPGQKGGIYLASSDEHDEFGYSTEESNMRIKQVQRRKNKIKHILNDLPQNNYYESIIKDILIIGWGSTKGVILDSLKNYNNIGFIQIVNILPFLTDDVKTISKEYKKIVLVENNESSQLKDELQKLNIPIYKEINKYDGRPYFYEELTELLTNIINE